MFPLPMKLQALKAYTFELWQNLHEFNGAVPQAEKFKPEIRKTGDMRRKDTWMKAAARFSAWNMIDTCLDAFEIITIQLNFTKNRRDYALRNLILDEFLAHPEGPDIIRMGLEQLFSEDFTETERQPAYGLLELVGEQRSGDRGVLDSIKPDWGGQILTGSAGA